MKQFVLTWFIFASLVKHSFLGKYVIWLDKVLVKDVHFTKFAPRFPLPKFTLYSIREFLIPDVIEFTYGTGVTEMCFPGMRVSGALFGFCMYVLACSYSYRLGNASYI